MDPIGPTATMLRGTLGLSHAEMERIPQPALERMARRLVELRSRVNSQRAQLDASGRRQTDLQAALLAWVAWDIAETHHPGGLADNPYPIDSLLLHARELSVSAIGTDWRPPTTTRAPTELCRDLTHRLFDWASRQGLLVRFVDYGPVPEEPPDET